MKEIQSRLIQESNFLFNLQISLILEYCSKGNLRAYLVDHESEFMNSLKYFKENDCVEPLQNSEIGNASNDVFLLHRWSYQVNLISQGILRKTQNMYLKVLYLN